MSLNTHDGLMQLKGIVDTNFPLQYAYVFCLLQTNIPFASAADSMAEAERVCTSVLTLKDIELHKVFACKEQSS